MELLLSSTMYPKLEKRFVTKVWLLLLLILLLHTVPGTQ